MRHLKFLLLGAALLPVTFSSAAFGQSREPFEAAPQGPLLKNDVAGARQAYPVELSGVRVGPVTVLPSLTARVEADSNVLNRTNNTRGDVFVVLAPQLRAVSRSGDAMYVLQADAAITRFAKLTQQDRETFGLEANATVPVMNNIGLFGRASFDRRVELNANPGAGELFGSPVGYDQAEGQLAARLERGATRVTIAGTVTRLKFEDLRVDGGARLDQSFRDTDTEIIGAYAEHSLRTGLILTANARYSFIDSRRPLVCCDRTAEGGQALAGFRADISPLISADVAVGYGFRNFKSPLFKDFGDIMWRGRLDWYTTRLISVSLGAKRTFANSGVVGSAIVVLDDVTAQVFYEFRRNLNLVATAEYGHEDYRGTAITAKNHIAGLEARYAVTPQVSAAAYSRYHDRSTSNANLSRTGKGVEFGIWLRSAI